MRRRPAGRPDRADVGRTNSAAPASARALRIVDVRTAREWRAGHVDGIHQHSGRRDARADRASCEGDGPIATMCEGGYRSSLAASLLAHEGVPRLINVVGGMAAYRALETT